MTMIDPDWPDLVQDIARLNAAGHKDPAIARQLCISKQWVQTLRQRHGIARIARQPQPKQVKQPRWTDAERDYLIAHADESDAAIGAALGRPVAGVQNKRFHLGQAGMVPKRPSRWSDPGTGKASPYTADELRLIDDLTLTIAEVVRRTGRTERGIRFMRSRRCR